jgi:glycosyltransferase involved in cell wall biosynthesis
VNKKRVLFVGSFVDKAKDGSVGGQMFACKSLLQAENLSEKFEWILLDTTGKSVPPPPAYKRLFYATLRIIKFVFLLIVKRPHTTLVFSGSGTSIYEKGLMILIASSFKVKTVFAPRGGPIVDEVKDNKLVRVFLKRVLKSSKFVVCQGSFWKRFFKELDTTLKDNALIVIPNWINPSDYQVDSKLTPNKNYLQILFMGWIQEDKGVYELFNAINQLESSVKIKMVFMGDGPSKMDLIKMSQKGSMNKTFVFPGWVYGKEKLDYLSQSDIFILPSYNEGLPNSLMEAMITNNACIATNVGAVPDLIIDNETGLLIEKQNIDGLKTAILKLINNNELRLKLQANAYKRIINNHSIEFAVEYFHRILA